MPDEDRQLLLKVDRLLLPSRKTLRDSATQQIIDTTEQVISNTVTKMQADEQKKQTTNDTLMRLQARQMEREASRVAKKSPLKSEAKKPERQMILRCRPGEFIIKYKILHHSI